MTNQTLINSLAEMNTGTIDIDEYTTNHIKLHLVKMCKGRYEYATCRALYIVNIKPGKWCIVDTVRDCTVYTGSTKKDCVRILALETQRAAQFINDKRNTDKGDTDRQLSVIRNRLNALRKQRAEQPKENHGCYYSDKLDKERRRLTTLKNDMLLQSSNNAGVVGVFTLSDFNGGKLPYTDDKQGYDVTHTVPSPYTDILDDKVLAHKHSIDSRRANNAIVRSAELRQYRNTRYPKYYHYAFTKAELDRAYMAMPQCNQTGNYTELRVQSRNISKALYDAQYINHQLSKFVTFDMLAMFFSDNYDGLVKFLTKGKKERKNNNHRYGGGRKAGKKSGVKCHIVITRNDGIRQFDKLYTIGKTGVIGKTAINAVNKMLNSAYTELVMGKFEHGNMSVRITKAKVKA